MIPLIIAGVAAGVSIYGQIEQGRIQASAGDEANKQRKIEAQEVMERLKINRKSIYDQGQAFQVRQNEGIAASGRLSNDSTLSMLEDTNAKTVRAIYNTERDATFRAEGFLTEGRIMQQRGQEQQRAGYYGAAATALTAGYKMSDGLSKTSSSSNSYESSLTTFDLGPNGNSYGGWSTSWDSRK